MFNNYQFITKKCMSCNHDVRKYNLYVVYVYNFFVVGNLISSDTGLKLSQITTIRVHSVLFKKMTLPQIVKNRKIAAL